MSRLERLLETESGRRALKLAAWIVLAVVALAEVLVVNVLHLAHPHFWFEKLPAFGSLYGLISCLLIIVVSKALGRLLLVRREDYYDDD